MDLRNLTALLSILLVGCVGRVGGQTSSGDRTTMMSGGTPAVEGQFPATVFIPSCTASKIGARHFLTAAHCVVDRGAMSIEATFQADAQLPIYTGVHLGKEQTLHLLTVKRTSIHPSYAEKLMASEGQGVAKGDYAKVFDLALIEVKEPTDEITVASLDYTALSKGSEIVVGGYGVKVDNTLPLGSGLGGVIVEGDGGLSPQSTPTHRLDFAMTTVDSTNQAVHLVRNGYTIEGLGHVVSGGLFADKSLKLLPGDSGGAVFRDDGPEGVEPKGHAFTTIVGVNSFTGLGHSAFSRIDDQGPGACLRSGLAGADQDVLGGVPLFCGRVAQP